MSEMLELGTLLREERERQGLSIEELSERIKLAPRTLAFIESGTKSELPHPVYVKGFVKSYAMVLGLDPEELGAIVDIAYKDELDEEVAEPVIARREKKGCPVKLIAIVVLIAGLAAAGYYYMQSGTATLGNEEATVEVPVQPSPAQPQPVEQAPDQPEAVESAPVEPTTPPVQEKEVAPEAQPESSKPIEVVEEPVAVSEKTAPKAVAVPVVAPSDVVAQEAEKKVQETKQDEKKVEVAMRSLRIEATADCWVEATGDDFTRKEFLLRNGQGYTVTFPKNLSLRLGNSGGISLTLDGVPYSFNGAEGKVRTVHIAAL
ncbi:helix-turn-helix domain-containing protein [Halodesulfovibrio marinisediminis]|uniref:Cytoskeleton protein RodZ n=1 Tax=Halodesulfovibrio marinisediminis DSM 17456 TaxID=1121457 RepID=A0A1N6DZD8_9BACT|nr:RodZ domain-containing protein [Halodesulfovibrio marinisediminis]SIN76145.1 cytoskeleton protein RodZ [Halodesulfovibrio marinisediminis DSM 17456]